MDALKTRSRLLPACAVAAMMAVYFFSYFERSAIPGIIFNQLQTSFAFKAGQVVALGAMFVWIYGLMQIPVGMLADRFSGVRTLICGGLAMVVGCTLFPLAQSPLVLFGARALTAFGASFMYLSTVRELNRLFAPRYFTAGVGLLLFTGYCGGMTATLPFERGVAMWGWRHTLLGVATCSWLTLLLAAAVLSRLGPEKVSERPLSLAPILETLANRACWPLFGNSLIWFPIVFCIQTILGKKFLQDFGGMSSKWAAASILAMTVVSAAAVLLGGILPRLLHDRRKPCLILAACCVLLGSAMLLAGAALHAPGWLFFCAYLVLAAANIQSPSAISTMSNLNRPEAVAASISVINTISYLSGAAIGQAGGFILDRFDAQAIHAKVSVIYPQAAYVSLFAFLTVLAVLNLLSVAFVPETRGVNVFVGGED